MSYSAATSILLAAVVNSKSRSVNLSFRFVMVLASCCVEVLRDDVSSCRHCA